LTAEGAFYKSCLESRNANADIVEQLTLEKEILEEKKEALDNACADTEAKIESEQQTRLNTLLSGNTNKLKEVVDFYFDMLATIVGHLAPEQMPLQQPDRYDFDSRFEYVSAVFSSITPSGRYGKDVAGLQADSAALQAALAVSFFTCPCHCHKSCFKCSAAGL
jgi:hypothetical protein